MWCFVLRGYSSSYRYFLTGSLSSSSFVFSVLFCARLSSFVIVVLLLGVFLGSFYILNAFDMNGCRARIRLCTWSLSRYCTCHLGDCTWSLLPGTAHVTWKIVPGRFSWYCTRHLDDCTWSFSLVLYMSLGRLYRVTSPGTVHVLGCSCYLESCFCYCSNWRNRWATRSVYPYDIDTEIDSMV